MSSWFRRNILAPISERRKKRRMLLTPWLRQRPGAVIYLSFGLWFFVFLYWVLTHPGASAAHQFESFLDAGYVQFLGALWGVGVTLVTYWLALPESQVAIENKRLRQTQKQRIRILEGFEPSSGMQFFHDNRSIYDAIIGLLKRLKQAIPELEKDQGKRHYSICMLLCSPALDYQRPEYECPETLKKGWGKEFLDILTEDVGPKKHLFHTDLCHLPLGSHSGINAMDDFLAVLANYLSKEPDQFEQTLEALKSRTEDVIVNNFPLWVRQNEGHVTVRDHTINIPFQIVLVNGEHFKEVVVSFAGREILERHQNDGATARHGRPSFSAQKAHDIRGFFSNDPYVVETFHRIYLDYAIPSRRAPFVPKHTLDVMRKHEAFQGKSHSVKEYYFNLIPELHVGPSSFSPAIANSTKFTTWLLDKMLTTHLKEPNGSWCQKVLDIGAGTGVLGLTAYHVLRNSCGVDRPEVWAIEASAEASNNLLRNCSCLSGFQARQWRIVPTVDKGGVVSAAHFADATGRPVQERGFRGFDLVIGDLPFLDAHDGKDDDMRFLDPHHKAHQALFRAVQKPGLMAQNGVLVTAFSSLGGPEDIAAFDGIIRRSKLQVIQRVDFFEANYMWMVYVIMREADYRAAGDRFWWKRLGVNADTVADDVPVV